MKTENRGCLDAGITVDGLIIEGDTMVVVVNKEEVTVTMAAEEINTTMATGKTVRRTKKWKANQSVW